MDRIRPDWLPHHTGRKIKQKTPHNPPYQMKNRWIGALLTLPIAVLASEAAYRIAEPSAQSYPSGNCLVLALGAPSRADGTASALQRFRVEAAVDTLRQRRCRGLLLSGGAVRNERIEAVTMANLAKTLGVPADQLVIEPTARNTWQNVGCLHSRLLKVERVFVVSDSLHAQRAVRYACRQDARLCGRGPPSCGIGCCLSAMQEKMAPCAAAPADEQQPPATALVSQQATAALRRRSMSLLQIS